MSEVSGPPVVCATCRRPLDQVRVDGVTMWQHPSLMLDPTVEPHEPVPTQVGSHLDVVGACDFCGKPEVALVFPCSSFEIAELARSSEGDWASCRSCGVLVSTGDLGALADGVAESKLAEGASLAVVEAVRVTCRMLFDQFVLHRTGEPVRVEDAG